MLPALILISPTAMLLVMTRPEALGFDLNLLEREDLHRWIDATGHLGPILVVGLITVAIVASPLPSAPVALAAGATYGQTFGTILVVLGAELGAIAAFLLAHGLEHPFVERHLGKRLGAGLLGSQNALTFLVFGSRRTHAPKFLDQFAMLNTSFTGLLDVTKHFLDIGFGV